MNQHDLCKLFHNPLHLNSHLKNISSHGVKTSLTTTWIIFFFIFFTSSYSFISLIDNKNNSPWFIACSSLKERPSLSAVQFSMLWEALRFKELTMRRLSVARLSLSSFLCWCWTMSHHWCGFWLNFWHWRVSEQINQILCAVYRFPFTALVIYNSYMVL